ncbi:MAG: sigma-70 family RNA polymerase sigma factor [Sedimentisphaerales bacterium]|nr:sigma-70 family RNA polymerase sigma factor [Sedimentisphaerales bacterium]
MADSESALLQRFVRAGDTGAFAEIVRRHAGLVYGTCLRVLADADKAADATQETFFQLMKKAHEITGSIPSWLHRVAVGKAVDLIRADSRRQAREHAYAATKSKPDPTWREICPYVDEALNDLDERTRELLIRHCLEGRSMTELAEELGISRPTVSRHIESGLKRLRAQLQRRGIVIAVGGLSALLAENTARSVPAAVLEQLGKMSLVGMEVASTAVAPTASAGVLAGGVLAAANARLVTAVAVAAVGVGLFAYRHLSSRPPEAPPAVPPAGQYERRAAVSETRARPEPAARANDVRDTAPDGSRRPAVQEAAPRRGAAERESSFSSLPLPPEQAARPSGGGLDLSSPEATVRSFVRAVASGDAESVMACFLPGGTDFDNMLEILTANPDDPEQRSAHQMKLWFQSLDPDAEIPIVEVKETEDGVSVVWRVTFKRDVTMEGHTFSAGDMHDLDGNLRQSGESWLINGM